MRDSHALLWMVLVKACSQLPHALRIQELCLYSGCGHPSEQVRLGGSGQPDFPGANFGFMAAANRLGRS
jgi:hypothetical protein